MNNFYFLFLLKYTKSVDRKKGMQQTDQMQMRCLVFINPLEGKEEKEKKRKNAMYVTISHETLTLNDGACVASINI